MQASSSRQTPPDVGPAPAPPCDHRRIRAQDPEQLVAGLSTLYGATQARVNGPVEWTADVADFGPVAVIRGISNACAWFRLEPAAHVLLVPRLSGVRVSSPAETVEAALDVRAGVVSPGGRYELTTSGELCVDLVRMAPGFLAEHLESLTGEVVRGLIRFSVGIPLQRGVGAYAQRLCQLMAEEIQHGTLLEHGALAAGLHESLARALLIGQPHSHSHLLEKPPPPSSRRVVELVEEYEESHAGDMIRGADLVSLTGASLASIAAAFRAHRRTTPGGFFRARRLERARQRLLTDAQASVSQTAFETGFLRREAFEAAYFKAFGEGPEQTRRRGLVKGVTAESVGGGEPSKIQARLALLTPRERQVCAGVARGLLNKQVAAELGVTEGMVKKHRSRAMAKLGVSSAAELAGALAKLGW